MPDTEITRAQTRERARLLFVRSYDVELDFTHGPRHLRVRIYAKLAQAYARTAYACFDQPDLKAVFTFQVTAPAHWTVLSNQPQAPAERTRGDSLVLASENAGCVLISEQLLVRSPAASPTLIESRTATVLHEMAHMWFGDSATGQGPLGRGPPQCRRNAAACRAAIPDAGHKEAAWRLLTSETVGPETVTAVAAGFMQPEQPDLLAPYAARYLAELPDLWRARGGHLRVRLATVLFPYPAVTPEFLAQIDGFPAAGGTDPGLARIVRDHRDTAERVLRARMLPSITERE